MANEEQQPLIGLQKKLQEKKHTRNLRRLKYSCEEVYERMDNGLCIFCDELDTPGHHDLKHKGIQIFMVDDDLASQPQEIVTNPEPIVKTAKNLDSFIEPLVHESVSQVLGFVPDVLMVHRVDSHIKEVEETSQQSTNGNDKIVAHQLFDQMPNEYQKDLTVISNKEVLSFSHKDARVWEPGGLPTKMDHWDWLEKELKPYGESHMVATFLYFQMQVGKSNPADFKTFDRKRSNKTLSLEDEQDDEHEQNQVMKLISSWNNRIWEPGGLLIKLDKWNLLEKCYNRGILMRLMHWLSSMWWKETKSREFHRLSECSWVDIKTWHFTKHETQQTDFHVWHRWKNKAEKLPTDYALLELMMLGLVSFQHNKGDDVVGLVPKATVLREVSHCQSNDYGTIRHKLLLVRDTSSDGYKEDSWSFIWFILKELCSAEYEWENETIKKSFKELSKQERYHKLLFPKNQKLLNLEARFCTQYNDLEQLNTEHQSSPGLDYFTYLNFIWKQVFNCGCEAGHISYGFSSVGDVHEFFICSKFRNGDETYGKRLLGLNEISLLGQDNSLDEEEFKGVKLGKPSKNEKWLNTVCLLGLMDMSCWTQFSTLVKAYEMSLLGRDKWKWVDKHMTYNKAWKFKYIQRFMLSVLLQNEQHKLLQGRNIKCKMKKMEVLRRIKQFIVIEVQFHMKNNSGFNFQANTRDAELETTLNDGDTFQKPLKDFYRACSYDYMALRVLELIKDKASRKRKLQKNWWFKYKLNTWLSGAVHHTGFVKIIGTFSPMINETHWDKETWEKLNPESCKGGSLLEFLKRHEARLDMIKVPNNTKFFNYLKFLVKSYILRIEDALKGCKFVKFTMEQSEKPLITILSYEWFHSPRPPELSCCKEDEESTARISSLRTRMI